MKCNDVLMRIKRKYAEIPLQAKMAFWIMLCTIVQKGISLITVPVFSRLLTTEEYGNVSIYFSWQSIFAIIASFKLGAGVYNKGLSKYKDDMDGYCLAMQYTTSFITIILLGVYLAFRDPINVFTGMDTDVSMLMILETFFGSSLGFWTVRQQYDYKYKPIVAATLIYALLNPVISIILVLNTDGDRGYARILGVVVAQVIVGSFFYLLNIRRGKFKFNISYSKFAIKFNIPLMPHYFSEYILNQSDKIMIQKLCGYSDVAMYSVAYNAGMLLTIVSSSINQALTPWLYQSLDKKDFKNISRVITSLAFVIMLPIVIFIALAPEAIYLLAGTKYMEAVYVVPPVAGSIVFLFLYTNFANIEFYYNYNKFTMYVSLGGALLNIITNYAFIRVFGFVAAGYTTFFCYFVYCGGHYLFMKHIVRKHENTSLLPLRSMVLLCSVLLAIMIGMSILYNFSVVRYTFIVGIIIVCVAMRKNIMRILQEALNR